MVRHTRVVPRVERAGTATVAAARQNHLLAGLDEAALAGFVARAEHVRLDERAPIHAAGDPIGHVDFPLRGLVSIVVSSHDGSTVEVGPVGCDGMVGLPISLGGETDPLEAFVQVDPVEAIRLPTQAFPDAGRRSPGPGSRHAAVRPVDLLQHGPVGAVRAAAPDRRAHGPLAAAVPRSPRPGPVPPHPRVPGPDAGRPTPERDPRGRRAAPERPHRVPARGGHHPRPTATGRSGLRVQPRHGRRVPSADRPRTAGGQPGGPAI